MALSGAFAGGVPVSAAEEVPDPEPAVLYSVTLTDTENGTISLSEDEALTTAEYEEGETVTVYLSPDEGYVLSRIEITDKESGEELAAADGDGNNQFTFTMPAQDVTLHASFGKSENKPESQKEKIAENTQKAYPITIDVQGKADIIFSDTDNNILKTVTAEDETVTENIPARGVNVEVLAPMYNRLVSVCVLDSKDKDILNIPINNEISEDVYGIRNTSFELNKVQKMKISVKTEKSEQDVPRYDQVSGKYYFESTLCGPDCLEEHIRNEEPVDVETYEMEVQPDSQLYQALTSQNGKARASLSQMPTVGTVYSGQGTITSEYFPNGVAGHGAVWQVTFNTGLLAGHTATGLVCLDHGAANPRKGTVGTYTATCTSVSGGTAVFSVIFTPPGYCGAPPHPTNPNWKLGEQRIGSNYSVEVNGYLKITKSSNNPEITNENNCYSLSGAKYGVYSNSACTSLAATLTTTETGSSNTVSLPIGNYWIKEISASTGYLLDTNVYSTYVSGNNTSSNPVNVAVKEMPANDPAPLYLYKIDQETGGVYTQGAASLEGAEFTLKFYAGHYDEETLPEEATRTYVLQTKKVENPQTGEIRYAMMLDEDHLVSGDDFYYVGDSTIPTLPLGTITLEETKAPKGYTLENAFLIRNDTGDTIEGIYLDQIVNGDPLPSLKGGNEYTMSEQVSRGNMSFTKRDAETSEAMEGIPFEITSNTTGESHVIYTDENGFWSSEAEYIPHTEDTNGNDPVNAVEPQDPDLTENDQEEDAYNPNAGTWFGLKEDGENTEPDDSLGAFPYDTYTLEELPCEANDGKALYKGTFSITRHGYTVDLGTILNSDITLETKARDEATGTQHAFASENATMIDEISYTGLKKGTEYTLVTSLMDKETGEPALDADGKEITKTTKFKPATAEGTQEVKVTFDASGLAGKEVVFYEELYAGDVKVADHRDLMDEDQMIIFPAVTTQAYDYKTNTNVANAAEDMTIVDTVSYQNLEPGKKYTAQGQIYDAETGRPIRDDNGYAITAEEEFTASKENGSVDVTFHFDGEKLAGRTLVVYQTILKGGVTIAEHHDQDAESQKIYLPTIGTSAKDSETGLQTVNADEEVSITDTVQYENLKPGTEYTVRGYFVDQETEKAVTDIDGNKITAEAAFTPKKASGETEVEFQFDGSHLAGKQMVAFEELYVGNELIAEHKDIEDEEQLISFPSIDTNAKDADTDLQVSMADDKVVIKDTVTYSNLENGEKYILRGVLKNKETGESILDKDGEEITAETSFTPHLIDLNGRKETVTFEFNGKDLAGQDVVVFETLYKDDAVIGTHHDLEDKNQTVSFAAVRSTTALDNQTEAHVSKADNDVIVNDTVAYENLTPGEDYEAVGQLVNAETGKPAKDARGREIKAKAEFCPDEADGTVNVEFIFDGSNLAGETLVAFETIRVKTSLFGSEPVAEHKDLTDQGQTIRLPEIGTKAFDSDTTENLAKADGSVTIKDTVSYQNLEPGVQYTVKGYLYDKGTQEIALDDNDQKIEAETTFVAEDTDGEVEVVFTFEGRALAGHTLVAFEEMYLNGVSIAEHKDAKDESQTVYLPEVSTSAYSDEMEGQITKADGHVQFTDTVTYKNLVKDRTYVMTATLKDQDTGDTILDDDGKEVVVTKEFTPAKADGSLEMEFDFPGKGTEGKTLVVFEDISFEGVSVASHEDLNDESQQIQVPKLRTTAIESETDHHLAKPDGSITITDTVKYENLLLNERYYIEGILMDKETGEPLTDGDGKTITVKDTFVPETEDGTIDLTFELNGSNLEGKTIVVFEELFKGKSLFRTCSVAEHKSLDDEEQSIHVPKIGTTAADSETGMELAKADEDITIIDTVRYENLIPGLPYELKGQLIDKETGKPAKDDYQAEITATAYFTPEEANGTQDVTFQFSGESLEGKTVVAYEELFYNGVSIEEHKDINDEGQTMYLPKVRTTALDQDTGDHISKADEEVTVIDTLTYENLIPGYEYTVKGQLLNRDTGKVQKDADGKQIEAQTTFTAEKPDGAVDVTFVFNGEGLDPATLVCFENVFYNDVSVAEHSDLTDEVQTVRIPHMETKILDSQTELNMSKATDAVKATDTVTLANLLTDRDYILRGYLVDSKTGEPALDAAGNPIQSETAFTADNENDTKEVIYQFDGSKLAGKTLVAYEELFLIGKEGKETSVAEHMDLMDELQSLHFPKIRTTALDTETKDHIGLADDTIHIIDTVEYENVLPGYTYVMGATVRDAQTGEEVLNEIGTTTTWTKQFVARESSGSVEMHFEIPAKELEGKTIVVYENLACNGKSVADHKDLTDENQSVHIPKVRTMALDSETEDHISKADGTVTVTDTLKYENLLPGKEYVASGQMVDQETGEPALDGAGDPIIGETVFTPEQADGTVEVTFTFNGKGLGDHTLVVYEELSLDGVVVGEHKALDDKDQTIRLPKIGTELLDSETKMHISNADNQVVLVDTVAYQNLLTGRTYEMTGTLMHPDGTAFEDADGNPITASATFAPETEDGTVDVEFVFDASLADGKTAVAYEELFLGGTSIAEHKNPDDENQIVHFPKIGTLAVADDTQDHITFAGEEVHVTDTVSYENVLPGQQYQLKASMYDAKTGEKALDADGNEITGEAQFIAGSASGTEDVTFAFDASRLAGHTLVVYEELYLNGVLVGEHKEITDEDQSIHIPEIGTTITDSESGINLSLADDEITAVDEVRYTNLIPGHTYQVTGTLFDRKALEPAKDADGNLITAETEFTPKEADGTVDVTFTFDASGLDGKIFVAYETLYYQDIMIAQHEDMDDEAQTLHIPLISTHAKDSATEIHLSKADKDVTVSDKITYENLIPNKEYRITGYMYDKATGEKAVDADGHEITAQETFSPKNSVGTVDITYQFNGEGMGDKTLVSFVQIAYDEAVIARHTDLDDQDQMIRLPEIGTEALDKENGMHMSKADGKVTITDTVSYRNLVTGRTYRMEGVLVNTEDGTPLLDKDGNEITGSAEFEPEDKNGSVQVEFAFDGSSLAGKTGVVFEELYLEKGKEDYESVAEHKDLNDQDQTIHFPKIRTMAFDSETLDHIAMADEEVTITDTVIYENVIAGETYQLEGYFIDQDTGKAAVDGNGNEIRAEAEFTAEETSGEEDVTFTFNAKGLSPNTLTVFEEMFIGEYSIAEHKDALDADQSISLPEIGTTVKDGKTGTNLAYAEDPITITDTVKYEDLLPGKTYVAEGRLIDRLTQETATDADGNAITAKAEFVPETADGETEVTFTFNGKGLEGSTYVAYETVTYKDVAVAVHEDINDAAQTLHLPRIGTTALDSETEEHIAKADGEIVIRDTVAYENILPGQTYRIAGQLFDQKTGEALLDADGNAITAETEITPDSPDGEAVVTFTFDGTGLSGKTVVAFENMYLVGTKGALIASHEDLEDAAQTVQIPKIGTEVVDADTGVRISNADEEITLVDTVAYENLLPGKTYEAEGYLVSKETGKPIMDKDGSAVSAATEFTPEEKDGTVEVTFVFDGTGLDGDTLVVFEEVFLDGVSVGEHKDLEDKDQSVRVPDLGTKVQADDTGIQMGLAKEELAVTDTVSYENLEPGYTYTIKGQLINKADESVVSEAETEFTAEEENGEAEVNFTFDADGLKGETLVAFEELQYEGKVIGTHKDIEDEAQTLYLPEIATSATDAEDGDKEAAADDSVTIIDQVAYHNLIPGRTYQVSGKLMNQATGEAIRQNGEEITAEAVFTPEEAEGTVSVVFHFDASSLAGTTAVVFEKLYDKETGAEIANHEDINDQNQSVELKEVPKEPVNTPNGTAGSGKVQTGDIPYMYLFGFAGLTFLVGAGFTLRKKRNQ